MPTVVRGCRKGTSLVSRPYTLMKKNSLANPIEFLGLVHAL